MPLLTMLTMLTMMIIVTTIQQGKEQDNVSVQTSKRLMTLGGGTGEISTAWGDDVMKRFAIKRDRQRLLFSSTRMLGASAAGNALHGGQAGSSGHS